MLRTWDLHLFSRWQQRGARQRLALAAALLALIALGVGASLLWRAPPSPADTQSSRPGPTKPTLTVRVTPIQQGVLPTKLNATGNIVPWQEAIIGADVGGLRLIDVRAEVGQWVRKGQLLAVHDPRTLQTDLSQARAQWAQAQAVWENARNDALRAKGLRESGFYSAAQAEQSLRQERVAKAQQQSAQAVVLAAQTRLAQAQVRAPDDGVISARQATLGAVSTPGQELFRLIRQGRLEWRAELTPDQALSVLPGTLALLTRRDGQTLSGKVRTSAPSADMGTRNVLVYVDLPPEAAKGFVAGDYAQGSLVLGEREGLSVPLTAVVMRDGFSSVFTVDPLASSVQGQSWATARGHRVDLGAHFGDWVEVRSGLAARQSVISVGAGFVNDGDVVNIVTGPR
jgi:HlyD family secretion protein